MEVASTQVTIHSSPSLLSTQKSASDTHALHKHDQREPPTTAMECDSGALESTGASMRTGDEFVIEHNKEESVSANSDTSSSTSASPVRTSLRRRPSSNTVSTSVRGRPHGRGCGRGPGRPRGRGRGRPSRSRARY